jgi:hypothetical protein
MKGEASNWPDTLTHESFMIFYVAQNIAIEVIRRHQLLYRATVQHHRISLLTAQT